MSLNGVRAPTLNLTKLVCPGRIFTLRVFFASDDVVRFALRLRQQSNNDEPSLCAVAVVIDVLADLEVVHGIAPSLADGRGSAMAGAPTV